MYRLINIGLLVTSLFCYLEWADKSTFLFQAEYDLLFKSGSGVRSFAHPLILLPLCGQLLLLFALFRKQQNLRWTFIAMAMLSLLVLMIFLVGILSLNLKITASTLPFILISIYAIRYYKKTKKKSAR